MAKIGELGNSGLGQVPPGWRDNASKKTLFQQWPTFPGKGAIGPLEPYGNPAYEGYGYPAAGYGQKRNKVVKLALPKVSAPQLSSNGWEGKVPQGTRITSMGTLNSKSDQFTRAQVAVLQGLAGLGSIANPMDAYFAAGLRGLGQATTGQQVVDWLVKGTMPESFINDFVNKVVSDEKAVAAAYNNVQALKKAKDPRATQLEQEQQAAWSQLNTTKYYALLIPEFQKRLGFTSGKPLVSKPDYNYIKTKAEGMTAKVAAWLKEKLIGAETKKLLEMGYMTGSLNGLGVLPVVPLAVAGVVGLALLAYMQVNSASTISAKTRQVLAEACSSKKLSPSECSAAIKAEGQAQADSGTDIMTYIKYGAAAVGVLVLFSVANSARQFLPTKS